MARREPDPDSVEVIVEIPRGGRNKYEYDDERGKIFLDRVLYSSVHYPTDYGFIPNTLAADGDHLDALVVVEEPTFPGCLVFARPVGTLDMRDEKGQDQKILCVSSRDPRFDHVRELADLSPHWQREIENFFRSYKTLEGVLTEVLGWGGVGRAWEVIRECRERALRAKQGGG